ncbi:hypothetical protein [Phytoactinopolyspora halotolerans]|uniref:Uncharacterized protein n=1 Tax=Phytoactinopolyspora halotolerans TaxID=1981512 RepID=A0A6L9S3G7_9ACTN|nr:hypothetical protein [Phytoactinopolyspora halotolerans]NED99183.1 hypothetical protein [Phytoactinopolyspora halotolerans]
MDVTPRMQRNASRTVHLVVAATLGTYVYAPDHIADGLRPFLMFVGIPLAVLTGLFLWKQAWFRRALGRRRGPSGNRAADAPRRDVAASGDRNVG